MKKICFLIVLVLTVSFATAFAEGIDLSELSDGEISTLYDSILQEMLDRGIARSGDLSKGHYVVGKDIRAGSYNLCSSSNDYARYFVFKSGELFESYELLASATNVIIDGETVFDDESDKVDLEEGQVLSVEYGILHVEEICNSLMP